MFRSHFQHVQVNAWILVTGKSDVANFPGRPRFNQGGIGAFLVKDPVGIFVSENLVMLYEIDTIDSETL